MKDKKNSQTRGKIIKIYWNISNMTATLHKKTIIHTAQRRAIYFWCKQNKSCSKNIK